jgi:MYXO-CTERM domain-containing protein
VTILVLKRSARLVFSAAIVVASLASASDAHAAACNGDLGSGASSACTSAATPYCAFPSTDAGTPDAGATGTCGVCTQRSDCAVGHTGLACDAPTGACVDIDEDGDLLLDSVEVALGTNPLDPDSDHDGISDGIEVRPNGGGTPAKIDTDGDGVIDALDTDSDNDTVLDVIESTDDIDGDHIGNWRDTDDDGDTILTAKEVSDAAKDRVANAKYNGVTKPDDVDNDGMPNYYDTDADGDSKPDMVEGDGDGDCDGIVNYLDADDTKPFLCDAGAPTKDAGTDAGMPMTSMDAGMDDSDAGTPLVIDDGVLEGSGLFCSTSHGAGSGVAFFGMLAVGALAVVRRRTKK